MVRVSRCARGLVASIIAAAVAPSSPLMAQPSLTAVTAYRTSTTGTPDRSWKTNTLGGDFYSNTFITRGTNPTTDAFLFNGNAVGPLMGSGVSLGVGTHTFYLWGVAGYQPEKGVSLAFDGADTPLLASWYNTTTHTNSALGLSVLSDVDVLLPGVGLTAMVGMYSISITNFGLAEVTRDVLIGSYGWVETPNAAPQRVGRLELLVRLAGDQPPVGVPEPPVLAMLATALLALLARTTRRRSA